MNGYDYLKKFLREEGFKYDEKDSFISFKFEGHSFVAFKNDSSYVQISMLFYDVNAANRINVLETCNKVNSKRFVVKLTIDDDSVWSNYEFKPSATTSSDDFMTALSELINSCRMFYEEMQ